MLFFSSFIGNAAGSMTPPLLIFTGKRLPNQINNILPQTWNADVSESGWMNTDVFYKYITSIFYPWLLEHDINPPVVLFLDGHVSHRSLKLSEFCFEKKIVLVSFLPNTTHMSQPMDVVVFGAVKRKWASTLQNFKIQNREEQSMSKATFLNMLNECLNQTLTSTILQNSFTKTSLFPFNADNFDYSQLPSNEQTEVDQEEHVLSNKFVDDLNKLIEKTFPNRLNEFKSCTNDCSGDADATDLFILWKKANSAIETTAEIITELDNLNDEQELVEDYPLLDVCDDETDAR